uniref:RNA-directed DNA polymerase n=1 Tax=Photinus pyralis TaxID=7054 RepID=A0A1Y1MEL5_PHOPY
MIQNVYMHPKEFIELEEHSTDFNYDEQIVTQLPRIKIQVEGKPAIALIDTGAEVSLMAEKFIKEQLGRIERYTVGIKGVNLASANQAKFACVKRKFILGITVGNRKIERSFLVLNGMSIDCIIGMDILSEYKGVVDLEKGIFKMEDVEIKLMEEGPIISNRILNCQLHKIESERGKEISTAVHCHMDYKNAVIQLLEENKELINEEVRMATGYQHRLQVDETRMYKTQTYSVPYHYRQEVKQVIKKMLSEGIIERASTNVINPLVVVKKKDGTIRLCLDARELNKRTEPQFESPQRIESLIGRIGRNKLYTKLDLKNSFWLIPLEAGSRKFTGFSVDGSTYQFKVVPFGLASSCAALVRAMQEILDKYDSFCLHYVDDIIIFSNTVEQHKKHLEIILRTLNENGMKLHLDKCEFFARNVKFLGFEINQRGSTVERSRLEEIGNFPRPNNLKKLRGFLGLMNYYRKFIPEFSGLSLSLVQLLRKGERFVWDDEKEAAFVNLKKALLNGIELFHPDWTKDFVLRTDASDQAVAGVLSQIQEGEDVPICFLSRVLRGPEVRYSIAEKEMLAIIYCITKLKFYLIGKKFTIETDHRALTHLMSTKFANNRIYRWSLILQEFTFEIKYITGKDNVVADILSRKGLEKRDLKTVEILVNRMKNTEEMFTVDRIREDQSSEEFINLRRKINEKETYKGCCIDRTGVIIKKIGEQELYVVTNEFYNEMSSYFHIAYGHAGVRKIWLLMRENFYSKRDLTVVKEMVNKCHLCCLGKYKNFVNYNEIKSIRTREPLEIVAIDYLSNLVKSGRDKHILVMVDLFSRFTKLYAVSACNTEKTVVLIDKFIQEVGKPKKILADNATYFNNDRFRGYLGEREINLGFCSIRHPQGNPSERFIQEVIKYLRMSLFNEPHKNWGRYVKQVERFINETPSTVTEQPPVYVMFGVYPDRPWEFKGDEEEQFENQLAKIREKVRKKQDNWVRKQNEKVKKKVKFEIGDLVILRKLRLADGPKQISAKLLLPYEGPYVINRGFGDSYELRFRESDRIRGRFHVNMLYRYDETSEEVG